MQASDSSFERPKRRVVRSAVALLAGLACAAAASAGGAGPLLGATSSGAGPLAATLEEQTDRLIVHYRDGAEVLEKGGLTVRSAKALAPELLATRLATARQVAAASGLKLSLLRQTGTGSHVLKLDRAINLLEARRLADSLRDSDAAVEYAEPDRIAQPLLTPNDTLFPQQWDLFDGLGGIRMRTAWDLAPSAGSGVVVAVIDTGIRPHSDLTGQTVAGYDLITSTAVSADGTARDADPTDPGDFVAANQCATGSAARNSSWHGTHVAGTIAARANNARGIAGMAFNARVQPVRVLGKCGGFTSDIADGMIWASGGAVPGLPANATRARVLNLSLGGGGVCSNTYQAAVNSARSRGAVVVVSAGNSNQNAANFQPASCNGVITVGATDRNGRRAPYSNFGQRVTLSAPGGDTSTGSANGILSTLNAGATVPGAESYAFYQGTSMAAPHVSAMAAILLALRPALTPDQVATLLRNSARAFPVACFQCGGGLLDAVNAVRATVGPAIGTIGELEPNAAPASASAIAAPSVVSAGLAAGDTDWFRIDLPTGRTIGSMLTAANTTADYDLYAYNAAGTLIASSAAAAGWQDTVFVSNTSGVTQRVYLQVRYFGGPTGAYTMKALW